MTARCTVCGEDKMLSEFYTARTKKLGRQSCCKVCANQKTKAWRVANLARSREISRRCHRRRAVADPQRYTESGLRNNLRKNFGITLDELHDMEVRQGNRCRICGSPPQDRGRFGCRLAVDHEHSTGVTRGLLCHNCNVGLGMFADSPERLEAAANYLRTWEPILRVPA